MKSSAIRNIAGLTAIACLGLLCPAAFASVSPSATSTSTADAIASGVITNAQGKIDRSGEVYVFALPDQSQLIGKPAGVSIPLTLVGYARTNAHGQYAVDARSANLMTTNGRHGYLNLQVIAVSGGKMADADYSVAPVGAAWRMEGGSDLVPSLSFNFAARLATLPPVAATVGASAAAVSRVPITPRPPTALFERLRKATDFASAPMPSSSGTPATPKYSCPVIPRTIYYNKPEHFLTVETFGGKIPETVDEGTDSSSTHTLGIAIDPGDEGKWSADGTGSITDSSTSGASVTYSVPHTVYNRVNYRDYFYACTVSTERRPYSFYDLLTSDGRQVSITWQYHCAPHPAGTTWYTQTASSATIDGGVGLGPINVSAQAGFGTSVQLSFHFNKPGEVCGSNQQGPVHSSLVEADPY